jgi:hypothetical protein
MTVTTLEPAEDEIGPTFGLSTVPVVASLVKLSLS